MVSKENPFDLLVKNAFDFLNKGISDFDSAPKYSVINFSTAIELFLKARLIKEHWSLVVSKPEKADKNQFVEGEFSSVNLLQAKGRLQTIAGINMHEVSFSAFRQLANHRNKLIHFYHVGLESDENIKELIVREQCKAWFYLHRLLLEWDEHFHEYGGDIDDANETMKNHSQYLETKFNVLKQELDRYTADGNPPGICAVCSYRSVVTRPDGVPFVSIECKVCDYQGFEQFELDCPSCLERVFIAGEGYASCDLCNHTTKPSDVEAELVKKYKLNSPRYQGSLNMGINCGNCEGFQTVVCIEDVYFCTSCFEIFNEINDCEWCAEPTTGDVIDSYLVGCVACGGRINDGKD